MNGPNEPLPQGNAAIDENLWDTLSHLSPYDFILVDQKKTPLYYSLKNIEERLPKSSSKEIIEYVLHQNCKEDPCELDEFISGKQDSYRGELVYENQADFKVDGHRVSHPTMEGFSLLFLSDQSDHRRNDIILKENERQMRAFLDASPDVFLTVDENGIVKSHHGKFDSTHLLGSRVIGRPLRDILHLEDFEDLEKLLLHSHEGALVQSLRTRWLVDEEQLVHLEIRVVPGSGKDRVILLRDRTELFLKEENIRILEQSASMVEIVGGVGKELSNQLHTLRSYCDILIKMEGAQDKLHYLRRIEEAAQQSSSLLENLFSYSQGSGDLPKSVSVSDLLDQAIAFCRFGLPPGIELRRIDCSSNFVLHLSERQTVGMFINIIMNAREAIEGGEGKILLSCAKEELSAVDRESVRGNWNPGSFIRVDISDTGCGIEKNLQEKIFDPLYSSKTHQGGTGMGLSILRGYMQQLQGGIALDSTIGHGTTFRLYFPELSNVGQENSMVYPQDPDSNVSTLNPQVAIDMLEGNLELYHTICRDFKLDYGQASQRVEEFVQQGAWEQARIIIHSIKGLAGLIGALELQEESRIFEIILKDQSIEEYPDAAAGYARLLGRVLKDIQLYLNTNQIEDPQEDQSIEEWEGLQVAEDLQPLVQQLAVHLELAEYNQCLERIAELRKRFQEGAEEAFWNSLSDQVRQFDFAGPSKIVGKLITTFNE